MCVLFVDFINLQELSIADTGLVKIVLGYFYGSRELYLQTYIDRLITEVVYLICTF